MNGFNCFYLSLCDKSIGKNILKTLYIEPPTSSDSFCYIFLVNQEITTELNPKSLK